MTYIFIAVYITPLFERKSVELGCYNKSVLLPLDSVPPSVLTTDTQVQLVYAFKYLRVQVSSCPEVYIALSLITQLAAVLSVIGRANLV